MKKNTLHERLLNFLCGRLNLPAGKDSGLLRVFRGVHVAQPQNLSPGFVDALKNFSTLDEAALLTRLETSRNGLDEEQVEERLLRFGYNAVAHQKAPSWWMHLFKCYCNPFNLLLSVLAVISYLTHDMEGGTIIAIMVLVATIMRFVQEGKSNRAAAKLKAMVSTTATVIRQSSEHEDQVGHFPQSIARGKEIPIGALVPGDIVLLSAGDMVPADVRVLTAKDLFVSQSALTGESLPVEKFSVSSHEGNPLEAQNLAFLGTNVISGSAVAVVIHTGQQTYFGSLAERLTAQDRTTSAFQHNINRISWLLIQFMLVMLPLVLLINGFTKHDWLEAALFALSVAVGLTPEMLPTIVTATLAKGAVVMSKKKVIVKNLEAIQNLGAMTILCTDKTGTLTQDKICLERHTDIWGKPSEAVLEYAYLNSFYQSGLKNLLDVAVLQHAELHQRLDIVNRYRKIDEIPFDFERRRMSVVVSENGDHHELICKGAVEEMLAVCGSVQQGDRREPLTPELLQRLRAVTAELNTEGLRVVAVAAKDLPPTQEVYGVRDEKDLVLIGYIAFLDPPKESALLAIKALKKRHITVKVLTGDNDLVTAKICREVGLPPEPCILGEQIDAMSDEALAQCAQTSNIFAKLTPTHKERIVRALRESGHTVGFMGDGINDAPALRAADVGISVDSAVDIAKEAADLILLEKSLMVLESGIIEGRHTFANMIKYIKIAASSNFGNVFSILIASAFLPFLPILPLQILVQNLLYDISQTAVPFDHVDEESLARPLQLKLSELARFIFCFGPLSSIFDIITFALLWNVFGANSLEHQTLFQSGWFVEGLLSQTLIVHMVRTRKIPFIQSCASAPLLWMTFIVMAIGVIIPMTSLASVLKMQALPWTFFPYLAAILLGYALLVQGMKRFYGGSEFGSSPEKI